jgi:hypothetical protein
MNLLLVKFLARASRSGKGELAEVSLVPIQELQYVFKKKNERIRKGPNDG